MKTTCCYLGLAAILAVTACAKKDPLYCDESTPCEDPALPFCDLTGEHQASEGIANTCIPDPFAGPDASVPESADGGTDAAPAECTGPDECDDGMFCNGAETCGGDGMCAAGSPPDLDDQVACTVDTCVEASDTITHAPDDDACSNQDLCDGVESCHPDLGCVSGNPVQCPADTACKVYSCVPASGNCIANDKAYNIDYVSPCGNGTVGLTCGASAEVCSYASSADCTYDCACEMNSQGELRIHCVGTSSNPQVGCGFVPRPWVTSGCSTSSPTSQLQCCF